MNKTVIALSLLLAAPLCQSNELELDLILGAVSKHFVSNSRSEDGKFNEINTMIGIQYHRTTFAYFKNSYNNDSFILGYNLFEYAYNDFDMALSIGVVKGYVDGQYDMLSVNGYQPIAVPSITYSKYFIKPTVSLLGPAVALSFKVDLVDVYNMF